MICKPSPEALAPTGVRDENPVYWSLMAVAFMNTALSRMMETQAMILRHSSGGPSPAGAAAAGRGLSRALNEIARIHMAQLLRFQDILGMIDPEGETPPGRTDGGNGRPTAYLPEFPSDGAAVPSSAAAGLLPGVRGRLQGIVTRREDPFGGGTAVVQTVVDGTSGKECGDFLCYSVMRGASMMILMARPGEWGGFSVSRPAGILRVEGEGTVVRRERARPDVRGRGHFVLTVRREADGGCFEMAVDGGQDILVHRSGEMAAVRTAVPFHY